MEDFSGRVAVVTGAASGMGRAFAQRFAEEGMRVVLADIEEPALERAVEELRAEGHDALGVRTDVADPDSVEGLAARTYDAYGAAHILCNNAGVSGGGGPIWQASLSQWEWTLGVNLYGVVHGIRSFVPRMLEGGEEGVVVSTSSMSGLAPAGGVYGAAKHAVVTISETLYLQLLRRESKVTAAVLCPWFVRTNIRTSERNRPAELQDDGDAAPRRRSGASAEAVEAGMDPSEVAGILVEGIRDGRFYILTNTEVDGVIRDRYEAILARGAPRLVTPAELFQQQRS